MSEDDLDEAPDDDAPTQRALTRVCLLVADDANHRLLAEWLRRERDQAVVTTPGESLETPDAPPEADVFVVDEEGLRRHEALVAERTTAAEPVFVPCLLVSERGEAALSSVDDALVDDVVELPAEKATLGRRLDRLLHEREQSLELDAERASLRAQNERLRMFAARLAHDLRNPLGIATGYVEQAREDPREEHFDVVENALARVRRLIDETLMLAKMGQTALDRDELSLAAVAREGWSQVETGDRQLTVAGDAELGADESRLQELFENLFRNCVEHGGPDTAVRVGLLDDGDGFYVADDGPGIPESDREQVFEVGYTTHEDGTGFGLRIVQEIAEAHGWTVDVTESATGGARIEVAGVDLDRDPD